MGAVYRNLVCSGEMLRSSVFFDVVALPYELLTRQPVWEEHCARMALELPQGARHVVDVGCGAASSTIHLPRGAIGGDAALAMLRRARRRAPPLPLVALDASSLPFRSGSVDAVTFHSVLYLLPDQAGALRDACRVLRRGGRAILLEPQRDRRATVAGLVRSLRRPRWALTALCWRAMSSLYGGHSKQSLQSDLERAGLRVLRIEETLEGLGLFAVAEKA